MGTTLLPVTLNTHLYHFSESTFQKTEMKTSWFFLSEVSSSPVDVPQIKYGYLELAKSASWTWLNVSSPIFRCSEKVYFASFCFYNLNCFIIIWFTGCTLGLRGHEPGLPGFRL